MLSELCCKSLFRWYDSVPHSRVPFTVVRGMNVVCMQHLGAAGSVTTLAESYLAASAGSLAKCVAAGNALVRDIGDV
jgi:hypothetical protein